MRMTGKNSVKHINTRFSTYAVRAEVTLADAQEEGSDNLVLTHLLQTCSSYKKVTWGSLVGVTVITHASHLYNPGLIPRLRK